MPESEAWNVVSLLSLLLSVSLSLCLSLSLSVSVSVSVSLYLSVCLCVCVCVCVRACFCCCCCCCFSCYVHQLSPTLVFTSYSVSKRVASDFSHYTTLYKYNSRSLLVDMT